MSIVKQSLRALAAIALAGSAAGAATAQDTNGAPNYGTMDLTAGFEPDPRVVQLRAGGDLSANSTVSDTCAGFITNAPDVRLNYTAGSFPLIISVNAAADTTLVVNAPDGRWYCNDDGGEGSNPSIRFNSPQGGRYEIWIGTYRAGDSQAATLAISEVTSQ